MRRYLVVFFFIVLCLDASAQVIDSLFAVRKGSIWAIKYTVKPRENIHMLAQRFFLTDEALEFANEFDNIKKLAPGTVINIPVTKENYFINKQSIDNSNLRELYYHVGPKDDIGIISTYAGVTKNEMRKWNNLKGNTLTIGQVLFVGWVKIVVPDSMYPASFLAYPSVKRMPVGDTLKAIVPGKLDSVYDRQTNNGLNVLTEKGTAVFFEKPGKNNIYIAFHNASPRGAIIKVYNPGNGKTIYVKVLGPLPDTKQYANSIIGICSAAKEALGVTDNKAWCELSYAP
jgi:LysM repeat protein